jgi:hypothetical protein
MKKTNPIKQSLAALENFFRSLGKKASRLRIRHKTYRFAVYGRAASGKTCILAALAMKCIAHPSKYTSTWILEPVGIERPKGEPETWDVREKASAFHLGRLWLEKAIERLSKGELPPPNPNRAEPLRYLYHFTTPDHRTYPIELIDYSGELLDPAITNDDMAQRLREHISTMDGILVLAEVPHLKDDNTYSLTNELHKLEQAFAILKNESERGPTLEIPLALLINKWDRRSKLRYTTPEDEYQELLHFLESKPEPPHKALVVALQYSVMPENFKVFPVSAFGEHEISHTAENSLIERPKHISPMRPFGLEDGFIWAAQRRDIIDMANFERAVTRKSSLGFVKSATIIPLLPLLKLGKDLINHFPKKSAERKKARDLLKQLILLMLTNFIYLSVILCSCFYVGEVTYDSFRYRSVLATKSDPQTSSEQLKNDENWLSAYYKAPLYRHPISRSFVLKRNEAIQTLQEFRERREEMLWQPVEQSTDNLVRVELARKYLSHFGENGKYRDIAYRIVIEAEQSHKYLKNQIHVSTIATTFESILLKGTQNENELNKLYDTLSEVPYPQSLTDELYEQQSKLLSRISHEILKLAETQGKEKWLVIREKYLDALRFGDVSGAVDYLGKMQAQTVAVEETAKLREDFKKRAVSVLKNGINEKTKNKLWQQARDMVQKAQDNKQFIALLNAPQLKQLQRFHGDIDSAEDKNLYSLVVKYKTPEHVTQYLKYAPLKKMERVVNRYQQHLNRLANPLDLKLELESISWGGGCSQSDLVVTYNGKTIIEKTDFKPPAQGRSTNVGSTKFRAKLNDIAKIHARVSCESWWSGKKTGEASWEGVVAKLKGLRLSLEREGSDKSYITFTLSGLPEEPLLPAWGS